MHDGNAGKLSVPTDPLGAVPPTQFPPLDQCESVVAPLQVKSAPNADAGADASSPIAEASNATTSPSRLVPPEIPLIFLPSADVRSLYHHLEVKRGG